MGGLAIHTNSNVFAADRIQWYYDGRVIDFANWEGQLYRFAPDGTSTTVTRPLVEMTALMGRRADG